ncbi:unnamed protein product, partial [Rotaria sp. Silwood1]
MEPGTDLRNFVMLFTNDINPLESSSNVRIADFNAFKRCLTNLEIQAIHQQQISINQ